MVRRCVAINIEFLTDNLSENFIKEYIFTIWKILFQDILETVKVCIIASSKLILDKLNNHIDVIEYMVPKLKDTMLNKSNSWRLRYACADFTGSFLKYIGTLFI